MADRIDEDTLVVRDLSVDYGGRRMVDHIDLTLRRGDVLGLLGANGAGKSTFIRAITGQIRLASGAVAINGIDMSSRPTSAKAELGLAIDPPDLPAALSGRQYLELVASIRGCSPNAWPAGDLVEPLGLAAWLDRPIAEYSLGTRAKTAIAAALLGAPPLLILDESLNGLDPVSAWACKHIIRDLAATGRHAVIVATHDVDAVPALCNRALFLAEGRLVQSWDSHELADASRTPGAFEACVIGALQTFAGRRAAIAQG